MSSSKFKSPNSMCSLIDRAAFSKTNQGCKKLGLRKIRRSVQDLEDNPLRAAS